MTLCLTHLVGFMASRSTVQTLVDRTTGTAIGNLVNTGGLAAAFDGNNNQAQAAAASLNAGDRSFGYIGKDWGVGLTKLISGFTAYGGNDTGFNKVINPNVTMTLQGSTDNFSSSIVDLGNIVFVDTNAGGAQSKLSGIDVSTAYRYHRLKFTTDSGSNSTDDKVCAECQFYEEI